ncbi:MAG: helix-turn-helix transcriptional regulator [Saprospirales bacterium]|nr:helix-turn-helix transcriptional regulator [Saprospirales bacterium]MBK8492902.1 helix-turn-helix transcriptional regulator [Saprospirales bacterium]
MMNRMGERIRKRREDLNIQASDLANSIGVSASLISQIERGKAYPSILTLKKIANALHTTVGELIGERSDLADHPVVARKQQKFVKKNKTGTSSYLLSHHDSKKMMDPFLLKFKEKADSTEIMTTNNPGQEFCYVLKGKFNVKLGDNQYEILEGDSFYFTSNQNHLFTNTHHGESQLLWVVNQNNI